MSLLQMEQAAAAPWGAQLLSGLSIALEAGQVLGLAGPNGAGKSSLLRLIAGDIALDAGTLRVAGRERADWQPRELAKRLAFLPQLSLLNFPYTVEEVVLLGRMPHDTGNERDGRILSEVLSATDTSALRDRLYTQLSGGEKQRVQLARVFAQVWDSRGEGLLLLDEPTAALDLSHQRMLLNTIRELANSGCAIVMAVHDLNLVAGLADSIAIIDSGSIAAMGKPEEVLTVDMFRKVFAIEVDVRRHPSLDQPLVISR